MKFPSDRVKQSAELFDIAKSLASEAIQEFLEGLTVDVVGSMRIGTQGEYAGNGWVISYRQRVDGQMQPHVGTLTHIMPNGIRLLNGEECLWFELPASEILRVAQWLSDYENHLVRLPSKK